jgi:cytidylate kinase
LTQFIESLSRTFMMIAIDGPAASGKGTLAKRLARHYSLPHLDTGLLYRAVALVMLDAGHALDDITEAEYAARHLHLEALEDPRLRGASMGEAASVVAALPEVRAALIAFQRAFASQAEGAVLDGRDIGTVIYPQAKIKLFVTASAQERARRRFLELHAKGDMTSYEDILDGIHQRDTRDASRINAPLLAAPDAFYLDTTALSADDAFHAACQHIAAHT